MAVSKLEGKGAGEGGPAREGLESGSDPRPSVGMSVLAPILRRSLIPPRLPRIQGARIGLRASMAGRRPVGGDFADVFPLEGGWGISYGDVSGKGAEAASLGLMVKFMLRGMAYRGGSPSSVVSSLNTALCHAFGEGEFVTLVYARYEPRTARLTLCNGGEWPPMTVHGGRAEPVEAHGQLVGVLPGDRYSQVDVEIELAPDDLFVGYTDGIVEARRGAETFGVEAIQRILEKSHEEGEREIAHAILAAARSFTGGRLEDDAVVLVVRGRGLPSR